ncbi:hypothetical protein DDE18_21580 [Nocardioides gansuensis]|uniref:DUF4386 domain-containing protein n=1 Tax=Nocardioides gansuensis TaxID=2138300 RepID=A0A2T8F4V1_9ACTN|nr:hypothetical protein [Nocardioides gansuensis]PVG80738.1 hypothetical protein DDE18_21580 [Nocardioides gansuensis]
MTVTPTALTRAAGAAAIGAGAIFIGVNIGHPHMDATSIATTELIGRNSLKVLMAALALAGITGMYVSQIRRNGLLGLIGYLVFAAGYLLLMTPPYIAAFVLPSIAETNPGYVNDVLAAASGRTFTGDIGPLATVLKVQGFAYLGGGLLFGIALFRAHVLTRWATLLRTASGPLSASLFVMPDAFYRLLAFPNGIAMVALGYSLWRTAHTAHTDGTPVQAASKDSRVIPAGAW